MDLRTTNLKDGNNMSQVFFSAELLALPLLSWVSASLKSLENIVHIYPQRTLYGAAIANCVCIDGGRVYRRMGGEVEDQQAVESKVMLEKYFHEIWKILVDFYSQVSRLKDLH